MSAIIEKGDFHLVIPAYREAKRLRGFLPELAEALTRSGLSGDILVVDDGSPESEYEATRAFCAEVAQSFPCVRPVLRLPANRGKGAAIRAGWDAARNDATVLGFCDADGATPAEEVARLLTLAATKGGDDFLLVATRNACGRSPARRTLSRIFSSWVRLLTGVAVLDTQCGCKFISDGLYRRVRPRLREERYAFDVELLLAAKRSGVTATEVPVRWTEKPGGRFSPVRDGFVALLSVIAIRIRSK